MLERKNGIKSSRNLPAFEIPILIGNGCQITKGKTSQCFFLKCTFYKVHSAFCGPPNEEVRRPFKSLVFHDALGELAPTCHGKSSKIHNFSYF